MRSARQAGKWSSAQYSTSWLRTNTYTHTHAHAHPHAHTHTHSLSVSRTHTHTHSSFSPSTTALCFPETVIGRRHVCNGL